MISEVIIFVFSCLWSIINIVYWTIKLKEHIFIILYLFAFDDFLLRIKIFMFSFKIRNNRNCSIYMINLNFVKLWKWHVGSECWIFSCLVINCTLLCLIGVILLFLLNKFFSSFFNSYSSHSYLLRLGINLWNK